MNTKDVLRFWSKVKKTRSCWVWTGGKHIFGYGRFRIAGKTAQSHRLSWELHYGEIPKQGGYHGTCICHRCDNPACVNPKHLFLATQADNMRDRNAKGRNPNGYSMKNR